MVLNCALVEILIRIRSGCASLFFGPVLWVFAGSLFRETDFIFGGIPH